MVVDEMGMQYWEQLVLRGAIALIALGVLWLLLRKLTILPDLPSDFDLYLHTSGIAPSQELRVAPLVQEFQKQYGNKLIAKLEDNKVTSPSLWVQGMCAESVKKANSFDLVFDCPDFIPLTLSSDNRFTPVTIDINNYDETAGGPNRAHIHKIRLLASDSMVTLQGLRIHELTIAEDFRGRINILNCWIRSVRLEKKNSHELPSVIFFKTWVGNLFVAANCTHVMEIIGGGISRIGCVSMHSLGTDGAVAFTGNVEFRDHPPLVCKTGNKPLDPQEYRNLSNHLSMIGNINAEKYVMAFEKRLSRNKEGLCLRFISFLYDASSFYGVFPGRALIWLLSITMTTTAIIYFTETSILAVECDSLRGWQTAACGDTPLAAFFRSALLSLESILNPFKIFSSNFVVVSTSILTGVWLFFQGLISLALLALIVIGIRRKFISR